MNFKKFVFAFAGLWVCAFFIHSCTPSQYAVPVDPDGGVTDDTLPYITDVVSVKKTGTVQTEIACLPESEVNARWCWDPSINSGGWSNPDGPHSDTIVEECLLPHFQESFDFETGIWAFQSSIPVCTEFFEIPDSECEWLHGGYIWSISKEESLWEGMVKFPEEWVECVGETGGKWWFEVRVRMECPE